jgi:hypothetical protein
VRCSAGARPSGSLTLAALRGFGDDRGSLESDGLRTDSGRRDAGATNRESGAGAFGLSGWIVIRREELVFTLRVCEGPAHPLLRRSPAAVTRADNQLRVRSVHCSRPDMIGRCIEANAVRVRRSAHDPSINILEDQTIRRLSRRVLWHAQNLFLKSRNWGLWVGKFCPDINEVHSHVNSAPTFFVTESCSKRSLICIIYVTTCFSAGYTCKGALQRRPF